MCEENSAKTSNTKQTSADDEKACFDQTKKCLAWRAFEYMIFNDEENQ